MTTKSREQPPKRKAEFAVTKADLDKLSSEEIRKADKAIEKRSRQFKTEVTAEALKFVVG